MLREKFTEVKIEENVNNSQNNISDNSIINDSSTLDNGNSETPKEKTKDVEQSSTLLPNEQETEKSNNQEPKKVETRGRKKKNANVQGVNVESADLSAYKKTEVQTPVIEKKKIDASKYVTGALLLMVVNSLMPELLILINPKIEKQRTHLELDAREQAELKPLADEVVKELLGEMSPLEAFIIALISMYAGKYMIAVAYSKAETKK